MRNLGSIACLLIAALLTGCGGSSNAQEVDASLVDAHGGSNQPRVGPLVELPILEPVDSDFPFNHTHEVSVAAYGDDVIAAYVNRHLLSEDSFEADPASILRRVGVAVSHDAGDSFVLQDPAGTANENTSDPVARAGSDGTFWLARISFGGARECLINRSNDGGRAWPLFVGAIPCGDKEWIAVDDATERIYMSAVGGWWKYTQSGGFVASSAVADGHKFAGYGSGGRALFVAAGADSYDLWSWDGTGDPALEVSLEPGGPFPVPPSEESRTCVAIGETIDGKPWVVREVSDDKSVVARVLDLPADTGTDVRISRPGSTAFFPAADTDDLGRLHVVWYESTADEGVLLYSHSLSSDFSAGFLDPTVVDPVAVPTGGWHPLMTQPEIRRLREYIDLAVSGQRAYVAWTRAASPPSRVYFARIE
jgi:hypothetical protein